MMRGCPFVSILMLALCTSSEGEFDEARGFGARALGLGSTPMIGFDAEAVASEFALAEDDVPIMLLSVGAALPGNWPQKPRRPVADVLEFA
jgi:hypothetical protein